MNLPIHRDWLIVKHPPKRGSNSEPAQEPNREPNRETQRRLTGDAAADTAPLPARIAPGKVQQILDAVGSAFATTPPMLKGPRRDRDLVLARFAAVALMLEFCPELSLPAIGRLLGDRDHTTIIHSRFRARQLLQPDRHSASWRAQYGAARARLLMLPIFAAADAINVAAATEAATAAAVAAAAAAEAAADAEREAAEAAADAEREAAEAATHGTAPAGPIGDA